MKYSIVIPTYNHCDDLLKPCVESILKYTDMSEVELIISGNGCVDNTRQYLEEMWTGFNRYGFEKNFKVAWSDTPTGFAKATNDGIKRSTGDKIILLNNDIILLEQKKNDWLNYLIEPFHSNPNCGISCIVKQKCDAIDKYFAVFFCVMVDRKVFNKIGLLNEEYGIGSGEDVEFCIEAEKAGFEICQAGEKHWSNEINSWSGYFPIYHKGEGTVHDQSLVPNWSEVFTNNHKKLADKYNV